MVLFLFSVYLFFGRGTTDLQETDGNKWFGSKNFFNCFGSFKVNMNLGSNLSVEALKCNSDS